MTTLPSGKPTLAATDADVKQLLACKVHVGTKKLTQAMERYTSARRKDGIHVINLHTTWEKLILAARIIVAIENPADVCVISARPYGQRAVLKFSKDTNVTYIAGRFTPGTFTNQIQKRFVQPRLLIVTDPRTDHQPIKESAYVNIPVIALCDTDSPTEFVDVAIPTNNKGRHAIGLVWWLLAREVLRLRGTLADREVAWDVVVDLYFYRDPEQEEQKDEENKPGVDEAGAGAVDRGFTDNADWTGEPGAGVPGIAGASTADPNWTDNATGGEWATEGAPAAEGAAAPPSGW